MAELKYDHVVVGAGISGMVSALLLARNGRKVLLIEKAPAVGGSMARFKLKGVPFDTGFHFTGGLHPDGLVLDMLTVLGIEDRITPLPFSKEEGTRFILEDSGASYGLPNNRQGIIETLTELFPAEASGIKTYFEKVDSICDSTATMNLRRLSEPMSMLDEDYATLSVVLDDLFEDPKLKTLLAGYCLCYGASPSEVSFANHVRTAQGMHDGLARVEHGGDAFIDALQRKLEEAGVEIRCKTEVISCEEIEGKNIGAFRLNNGNLVRFESAVFTLHPKTILKILPQKKLRPAFARRIDEMKSSFGFFAIFGVCDEPELLEGSMLLVLPNVDLDTQLACGNRNADSMLFCISANENGQRAMTILEAACPEDYAEWADTRLMKRPVEYAEFKARKTERILERIYAVLPELKNHFTVLGSSTPLTFRDYLNSPDGSAYGVKQLAGQFNICGKLPLRNLYAAGQSAVLPGLMGAMVSAFIVCRQMQDADEFDRYINTELN